MGLEKEMARLSLNNGEATHRTVGDTRINFPFQRLPAPPWISEAAWIAQEGRFARLAVK